MKKNSLSWGWLVVVALIGGAFIFFMDYAFRNYDFVKGLFSGNQSGVLGEVAANSEASLAVKAEISARISMFLFAIITALQFLALAVGWIVISAIKRSTEIAKIRIKQLDNAEIFFDVPLYVGLFGTVSAFLVMTFSPQSSRLIAYSSTLIGIIFSLVLRVTVQYPLRKKLIVAEAKEQSQGEVATSQSSATTGMENDK
jgi:hypothetical protein